MAGSVVVELVIDGFEDPFFLVINIDEFDDPIIAFRKIGAFEKPLSGHVKIKGYDPISFRTDPRG